MKFLAFLVAICGAFSAEYTWKIARSASDNSKTSPDLSAQIVKIDFTTEKPDDPLVYQRGEFAPRSKLPFSGIHKAGNFTWTAIDGREHTVIQSLSKDAEMFKRLCHQNSYVRRRQFIYVNPAFEKVTREIYTGERKEVFLPGFDGEQLDVIVNNVESEMESWSGHLRDKPSSIVQASTVNDADLHIEIHMNEECIVRYEAREKNQWFIHEVDLDALKESQLSAFGTASIRAQEKSTSNGILATQ